MGVIESCSRARKRVNRLHEIVREQGVYPPQIEMLEGWLIFPDLHTNGVLESRKSS